MATAKHLSALWYGTFVRLCSVFCTISLRTSSESFFWQLTSCSEVLSPRLAPVCFVYPCLPILYLNLSAMVESYETLISVTYEGRSLQMRPDQLTVEVLSKVFRLIPQTMLLVSDVGTIATADEGVFTNVDAVYTWTVEGDRVTVVGNSSSSAVAGPSQTVGQTQQRPSLCLKQKPESEPQPYVSAAIPDQFNRTRQVSSMQVRLFACFNIIKRTFIFIWSVSVCVLYNLFQENGSILDPFSTNVHLSCR
jgi:hypothetical protein